MFIIYIINIYINKKNYLLRNILSLSSYEYNLRCPPEYANIIASVTKPNVFINVYLKRSRQDTFSSL